MSDKIRNKKNPDSWILYIITAVMIMAVGFAVLAVVYTYEPEIEESVIEVTVTPAPTPEASTPAPTPITNYTAAPAPTATPLPQIPTHILRYREQNEDTIGYISIEGTVIDYPVMYSGDNEFYLQNDFDKNKSYYGAIFLDYRCDYYDFSKTRNIILYGHRMNDGSMFKPVTYYFVKKFFDTHPIVQFDTLAGTYQWEVFTTFETHVDFYYIDTDFESDDEWLEFIEYCQSLSLYENDVKLGADDIVLTLSTCSTDKDYRVVLMARLIPESEKYKLPVK